MKKNQKIVSIFFVLSCVFHQITQSGALHRAAREGNSNEITRLLNLPTNRKLRLWPANPNKKNVVGFTPLMIAVMHKHYECVKVLLNNRRTDVGVCDNNGKTVVHWAAQSDSAEYLELINQDRYLPFYVNETDHFHNRPLHLANNRKIAEFLVKNGALLDVKNGLQMSPIDCAKIRQNTDVATFLEQKYMMFLIEKGKKEEIKKILEKWQEKEFGNRKKRKNDEIEEAEICQICHEEIEQVSLGLKFGDCKHTLHKECQEEAKRNGYHECTICNSRSQLTSAAARDMIQSDAELAERMQREIYEDADLERQANDEPDESVILD